MPYSSHPAYPEMHKLADDASNRAQSVYLWLNIVQIILLCAAALISGVNPLRADNQREVAVLVCVVMFVSLGVWMALQVGRFEVRWFKCRAFAENSKSVVWKYVMAEPYGCEPKELLFLKEWQSLKERLPELQREFAIAASSIDLVTPWMREISALPIKDKADCYRRLRLNDQLKWYAGNSAKNRARQSAWFWTIFALQCVIIAIACIQAYLLWKVNLVGFTVSAVAGMLAWTQTKRFSDLATTYAIAAEDLTEIATKYSIVETQDMLNAMVGDVEDAVSREHSMWLARRAAVC